jgi:hypothetical protein
VRSVGEQGKAVAENSRDDFNDDEGGGQAQRYGEAFGGVGGVAVCVH